jgi:hypothetical protein
MLEKNAITYNVGALLVKECSITGSTARCLLGRIVHKKNHPFLSGFLLSL